MPGTIGALRNMVVPRLWLACRRRCVVRLLPVLALMFLMVPSGDVLRPVLRLLTVKSIVLFASLAGLPHSVDGYSIFIGKLHYFVVDACSGLAYVTLT